MADKDEYAKALWVTVLEQLQVGFRADLIALAQVGYGRGLVVCVSDIVCCGHTVDRQTLSSSSSSVASLLCVVIIIFIVIIIIFISFIVIITILLLHTHPIILNITPSSSLTHKPYNLH